MERIYLFAGLTKGVSGSGSPWGEGQEASYGAGGGNAPFFVSVGGRASLRLILCTKTPLFLGFGGEEPCSEGHELVFQCYKALLAWVGYFARKEDRAINVVLFHFGDRTKRKRACVEVKAFSPLVF